MVECRGGEVEGRGGTGTSLKRPRPSSAKFKAPNETFPDLELSSLPSAGLQRAGRAAPAAFITSGPADPSGEAPHVPRARQDVPRARPGTEHGGIYIISYLWCWGSVLPQIWRGCVGRGRGKGGLGGEGNRVRELGRGNRENEIGEDN